MASLQFLFVLFLCNSVFCAETFIKIGLGTGELRTPDERANWNLVRDLFSEFGVFIFFTYADINQITMYDENEEVWPEIIDILYESLDAATALADIVGYEIGNKTLTVEVAKVHLGKIMVIFSDFYATIEMELRKLSEEGQNLTTAAFTGFFLNSTVYADNIYTALEEPDPASCGLVGFPENQTLIVLNPVDPSTPPGTIIWTRDTFSVSEIFLMIHSHNKYLDQEMTGRTLTLQASSEFPNFIDETGAASISRTVMFRCNDAATVTYTFEIPVNSDPIEEPTVKPKIGSVK